MTKRHLEYERVNMLDNECEDCDTCEEIETDLNNAMERLDNHLQIVSPYAVSQSQVIRCTDRNCSYCQ